ncbi:MAG: hypothetical protein GQ565_03905 [Candidatus Aegiribacteria sp.]|nr:hypothetical protein [Candidatus Aegiribacteria sp.]
MRTGNSTVRCGVDIEARSIEVVLLQDNEILTSLVPPDPQITGAPGAAIVAAESSGSALFN